MSQERRDWACTIIALAWLVICMIGGAFLYKSLLPYKWFQEWGFSTYMFAWVTVFFLGRAVLGWAIRLEDRPPGGKRDD